MGFLQAGKSVSLHPVDVDSVNAVSLVLQHGGVLVVT